MGQIGKFHFFNCSYQFSFQTIRKKYGRNILLTLDNERLNNKPLLTDKLHFLTVLCVIFKHFTVLKQDTLFVHMSCFRTCQCIEGNSHFEKMSGFGTCSAFDTFLRFESIISSDFLFVFREYISRNSNK